MVSPCGKFAEDELRAVQGVGGVRGLLDALLPHVEARYGLKVGGAGAAHAAYGLALALRSGAGRYVHKLTSSRTHSALADLFPWLGRLRRAGVPVPAVHRTREGAWFTAPLAGSDHDVAYLMGRAAGAPAERWSGERAAGRAALPAAIHKLGAGHEPRALGTRAFFADKGPDARAIAAPLLASPAVSTGAVERPLASIGRTRVPPLARAHVHGDARLCHVFFARVQVTGLIDCD